MNYHTSPGLEKAARRALETACLGADGLDMFDFYSCFPSATQLAMAHLGLEPDDPRPLSVTGGLPYAGGPGNNYTMHAVARVAEALRRAPEKKALVTAMGWYSTKHAAGVYSGRPPPPYTVAFGRDGQPEQGIVIGRLDGGLRFLANVEDDRELLLEMCGREFVGERGRVRHEAARGKNFFSL
ncbi:MAG: hypothetical protein HYS09_00115 [Chloroflexi bacterium]|nr:hypothetical protein [Chloroflexota bacterium]